MLKRKIHDVRLSSRASGDLVDIAEYISHSESDASARRVTSRILRVVQSLKRRAFMWREREGLFKEARIVLAHPYAILYRVDGSVVMVVRIAHGRRDVEALFLDDRDI